MHQFPQVGLAGGQQCCQCMLHVACMPLHIACKLSRQFLTVRDCLNDQARAANQLQKESTQRLQGFMDELRGGGSVDLAAKNLGEQGCAYVSEALAFNDR